MIILNSVRTVLLLASIGLMVIADAADTAAAAAADGTTTSTTGKTAYSLDNYCRTTQQLIADEERIVNSSVNAPGAEIQHFSSLDEFVKSEKVTRWRDCIAHQHREPLLQFG